MGPPRRWFHPENRVITLPHIDRRAWLALWAQKRRRHRLFVPVLFVLLPAPVLVATYPSLATWEWNEADPAAWYAYHQINGEGEFEFDDFVTGDRRQYAPDGGQQPMFIVGVNAGGNEITERSNVVVPDLAISPAALRDETGEPLRDENDSPIFS